MVSIMIRPSGSFLQRRLSLLRHGDQGGNSVLIVQQRWGRLVPAERCPGHVAALLSHHRIEPQPHLVRPLGRDQQHAALAFHSMSQERLAGAQRGRQIEHYEGLAGAPLPAEQPVPDGRNQVLDQPALDRPRIRITVGVERRQVRPRGRHLLG
jgi:hypothetical protein